MKNGKGLCLIVLLFFAVCLPMQVRAAEKVKGIDVSEYNGVIDWNSVKAQGYTYAMIKIGDGQEPLNFLDDVDEQFEANYQGAKAAGLKVGAYHVCCCRTVADAKREAQYCLKILNGRQLDYPLAYDMEMPGNFAGGKANTTAMAKAFCNKIKKAGYTPMIYSSASYLNTYFNWKKLSGVLVWAAHYGVKSPDVDITYHMWQYDHTGAVPGVGGDCDLNNSYLEKPEKITLKKKKITLKKGKSYQIKATLSPETVYTKLKYKSSKKSVATVSAAGKVTAKKKGKAVITVKTFNNKKAKLAIIVK